MSTKKKVGWMSFKKLINTNGITVKQLKDLVKDLPEQDEWGDDHTVWIETDTNRSNQAVEIWQLNGSDMLFCTRDGS